MRACPTCQATYGDEVAFCPEDGTRLLEPTEDLLGHDIGAYKLVDRIRSGAMGAVYIGQHPNIGARVAVKVLHRKFAKNQTAVGRFFNEARAANLIGHDNIVKVHDLGTTDDGLHYLVMELLEGLPLDEVLELRGGKLETEVGAKIGMQCCAALQAAHDNKIIHRDLKPENIFLTHRDAQYDFVKLLDFGVAKLDEGLAQGVKTKAGSTLGTPWYMSPEQALGEPVDARSDVYSMGIILYRMACGQVPFPEEETTASMVAHVQRPPPRPRTLNPDIPADYEAVILHALEKDRARRPQSAKALREEIARCITKAPVVAVPAHTISPPGRSISGASTMPERGGPPSRAGTQPEPSTRKTFAGMVYNTVYLPITHTVPKPVLIAGGVALAALAFMAGLLARKPRVIVVPEVSSATNEHAPAINKRKDLPALLPLQVKSEPPGAKVLASWNGGATSGTTPFAFNAPRGAAVHLEYVLAGYEPQKLEVQLDVAGLAEATLHKVDARKRRRGAHDELKRTDSATVPIDDDAFGDDTFEKR